MVTKVKNKWSRLYITSKEKTCVLILIDTGASDTIVNPTFLET